MCILEQLIEEVPLRAAHGPLGQVEIQRSSQSTRSTEFETDHPTPFVHYEWSSGVPKGGVVP